MKNKLFLIISILACVLLLTSCSEKTENNGEDRMENIIGIRYNTYNTMEWGKDFYAEISDKKIKNARFIRDINKSGEYTSIENTDLAQEDWEKLIKAVEEVFPSLKQKQDKENSFTRKIFSKIIKPRDGSSKESFCIIFENEKAVEYIASDDSQFNELVNLIKNIVILYAENIND